MLREFWLLHAHQIKCEFCGRALAQRREGVTFGHRRHTKIHELNYTVHHEDENRDNDTDSNCKDSHSTCHRRHHKKGGLNATSKQTIQTIQTIQKDQVKENTNG